MATNAGRRSAPAPDAERLAIEALTLIAGDPELASRFLGATGLDPESLRRAAGDPRFLAGVLDYVMTDEALILDLSRATGHKPESIVAACQGSRPAGTDDGGL